MIFRPPTTDADDELFHMTAMVDVVFILLAFFIVAAQFQRPERDLALGASQRAPAARAAAADLPSVIPVRLSRGDGGGVRIVVGQTPLPPDAFDGITAMLEQINLPDIPVVVDVADQGLTVAQVARAMDAVLASPMNKLAMPWPSGSSRPPPSGGAVEDE